MNKKFEVKVDELTNLYARIWENDTTIKKAVLIICHGMAEHIDRYDDFGKFLSSKGYIVFGYDQRGHGKSVQRPDDIGYMSDVDNFKVLVEDLNAVVLEMKNLYDLPLYVLGHSMGSFVAQRYAETYAANIDGIVFSGTNYNKGLMIQVGHLLSKVIVARKGRRHRSKTIHKLSFESFNKKYKNPETEVDWLSRDVEVCKEYVNDDMCGAIFTASYYMDLITGFKAISKNFKRTLPHLKILIVSGGEDPVGLYGKGPTKYYKKLIKLGLKDVSLKIYPNARHEILNELNKKDVYNDILNWLDSRV